MRHGPVVLGLPKKRLELSSTSSDTPDTFQGYLLRTVGYGRPHNPHRRHAFTGHRHDDPAGVGICDAADVP